MSIDFFQSDFANEAMQEINMVKYDDKTVERQDSKWQTKRHKG
mgnify:FL=1